MLKRISSLFIVVTMFFLFGVTTVFAEGMNVQYLYTTTCMSTLTVSGTTGTCYSTITCPSTTTYAMI